MENPGKFAAICRKNTEKFGQTAENEYLCARYYEIIAWNSNIND